MAARMRRTRAARLRCARPCRVSAACHSFLARAGALIFDKPEGRIVSIEALAAIPSADIFAFYRLSLPNLGWQIKPELAIRNSETFYREDEALTIKYEGGVVFFRLQPIAGN